MNEILEKVMWLGVWGGCLIQISTQTHTFPNFIRKIDLQKVGLNFNLEVSQPYMGNLMFSYDRND